MLQEYTAACAVSCRRGVQRSMRRTAWIWLAGCLAWTLDAAVSLHYGNSKHAVIAVSLALLFAIAWLFYRNQRQ